MEYLIQFDSIINNIQHTQYTQVGGRQIIVNILYDKNYKLEHADPDIIRENFDKIFLVNENFEAIEMRQTYLPNLYSISLTVEANRPFLFKFMRNNLLEYLDEDPFLISYQPPLFPSYIYNDSDEPWFAGTPKLASAVGMLSKFSGLSVLKKKAGLTPASLGPPKYEPYDGDQPIDNVYKWSTRWRWILPRDENNGQKYFFTFYIPKLTFEPINKNVLMRNEPYSIGYSQKLEKIPAGYLIQNKKQLITMKDVNGDTIGKPFYLNDVNIGTILDPNDSNNWLFRLIKHNLGYDANIVLTVNNLYPKDGNYIETVNRLFNDFSCRNANMTQYIARCITDNVEIAKVQLNLLKTEISQLMRVTGNGGGAGYLNTPAIAGITLNKPGSPGYYNFFSGKPAASPIMPAILGTRLNYSDPAKLGKENYFLTQFSVYPSVVRTYHRYNITIVDINIEMNVNVDIKNHPVQEVLQRIFQIFLNTLPNTDERVVKSFNTLSIMEYIEFIKSNVKEGFRYIQKWIVLNVLKNARNAGPSTPNGFPRSGQPFYKDELKLAGYTITNAELISGIATTDVKSQPYLTKIIKLIDDILVPGFVFRQDDTIPSEFNNELSRENLDEILTTTNPVIVSDPLYCVPLHYTGKLLIDKKLRIALEINLRFMLTLNWINRNIFALLYKYNAEIDVNDPLFTEFKYKQRVQIGGNGPLEETDPESVLEKLLRKINNNTEVVSEKDAGIATQTSLYNIISIFKNIDGELHLSDIATLDGLYNGGADAPSTNKIIIDVDGNVEYMSNSIPQVKKFYNKLFKKYFDDYTQKIAVMPPPPIDDVKYVNSYSKYLVTNPGVDQTVNRTIANIIRNPVIQVQRFNCLKLKYTLNTVPAIDKLIEDAILQNIRVLSELCIKYRECLEYSEVTHGYLSSLYSYCIIGAPPYNRSTVISYKDIMVSNYNSYMKSFNAVAALLLEYNALPQLNGADLRIGYINALKGLGPNTIDTNINNDLSALNGHLNTAKGTVDGLVTNLISTGGTKIAPGGTPALGQLDAVKDSGGSGSHRTMLQNYNTLLADLAYINFQKINSHIRGYTVSNLNETLAIFEKPIHDFAQSFWIDHTIQSIDVFIDELTTINKFKLFIKMLFIYTYLLRDEAGRILVNVYPFLVQTIAREGVVGPSTQPDQYEILLKDPYARAPTTVIDENTPLNFYDLLNNNETLNKLIKLASHKVISGSIAIESTEDIIKNNGFFDMTHQMGVYNKRALVPGPTEQSTANLSNKDNYRRISIKNIPLMSCIKYLVAALKWPRFQGEVNKLYSDLLGVSPAINVLHNNELSY